MLEASGNNLLVAIGRPLLNTFWNLHNSVQNSYLEAAYEVNEVDCHAAYLLAIRERDLSNTRELVDRHLIGLCTKYAVFPMLTDHPK
jgi:DNA-binding GntR family transcriptional regulator